MTITYKGLDLFFDVNAKQAKAIFDTLQALSKAGRLKSVDTMVIQKASKVSPIYDKHERAITIMFNDEHSSESVEKLLASNRALSEMIVGMLGMKKKSYLGSEAYIGQTVFDAEVSKRNLPNKEIIDFNGNNCVLSY